MKWGMASLKKSVEADAAPTGDPWDWSVDQVVTALCDQEGPWLRSINPISLPDPAFLEEALRENVVGGPTLLTGLTSATLREELGIKPLGHRTTLLHLIRAWQRQSPKYARHIQPDPRLSYFSGYEEVLRHFTNPKPLISYPGLPLQHVQSTNNSATGAVQPPGLPPEPTQQLPQTPLSTDESWSVFQHRAPSLEDQRPPHGIGRLTSEKLSLDGVKPIDGSVATNEGENLGQSAVANEQNKHGEFVPHQHQGNHDANSTSQPISPTVANKRQGEVYIIDTDGRKRRRLVLAVPAPSPVLGGARENSVNAEEPDIALAPSELFEGSSAKQAEGPKETLMEDGRIHATGVTLPALLQKDHAPGDLFIDNQGRKRMKPVLIWPKNHKQHESTSEEQALENSEALHSLPTTLPVPLKASPEFQQGNNPGRRNPKDSYLGIHSLAVDRLFYGHSLIGREIQNEVIYGDDWQLSETKESEFFNFLVDPFGCGQRQYVGNRIKHYLVSHGSRVFSCEGHKTITPYPSSLVKKNHVVSATVFRRSSHGIHAIRVDRSKWLDEKSGLFQIQVLGPDVSSNSDKFQTKFDDIDTSWDYLEKWKHKASEDEILPIYGDSGSEGQYDSETWQEMKDEEGKPTRAERPLGRPQNGGAKLSTVVLDEAIKTAIEQIMERWHLVNEPKLQKQGYNIWMKSRKKGDWHLRTASLSKRIEILKKRLIRMVGEIQADDWSTINQIQKQCKILQPSIHDLKECRWKLSILELETSPEKPSLEPRGQVQARISDTSLSDTPDNGKGRTSDFESSGDDLGDFITDDDSETAFFTAPDGNDPSISDSEDEESLSKAPDTSYPCSMRSGSLDSIQDEIKIENTNTQAIGQKIEASVAVASISHREFADHVPKQLDIIDLTQISESSDENKTGEVPDALSVGRSPPLSPTHDENPFRRDQKSLVAFKNPPIISEQPPLIDLDSDSSSQVSFPGFREVDKIRRIDASLLVERKDRKRLLIWTIEHTHPSRRQEVARYVDQSRSYDAQSLVWAGLNAFKFSQLRIDGLEKEESDTLMRIAAWYVCWTIPVKVSAKPPGVKAAHIATALADIRGFQVFYTFLGECLRHYKTDSGDALTPTPPKKRALLEDSSDSPNRTPTRKHRKYAVPESQATKDLRLMAQERVRERDKRQEQLKERLQPMGVNEDHDQVIVNVGKHDDQEFIYLNPKIGDRIQEHQKEGVRFMWREVVAGHQGCLLAQTMGLGKTMQVIALLVTIAEASNSSSENIRNQVPESLRGSRTLILCPVALVENWMDELLLWTPSPLTKNIGELHKVTVALSMKERIWEIETWKNHGGVLILGFNTFRDLIQNNLKKNGTKPLDDEQHNMVKSALLEMPNIIVADEAHLAKRTTSGINKCMKQLRSVSRIALTGSPLANNLEEYHSLIDWIAPNYLGTSVEFKANYEERIREGLWQESTAKQYRDSLMWLEVLKKELEPKVHRADISALAGRLKEKQEFVIRVPLTPIQEEIYRICLDIMALVVDQADQKAPTLWALLSLLRLLCNHPKCFRDKLLARAVSGSKGEVNQKASKKALVDDSTVVDEANALVDASVSEIGISEAMIEKQLAPFKNLTDPVESVSLSNKMLIFESILQFSREAQDKILVFSHTLNTLDYVEDLLKKARARYSRIDGKVKPIDRQQVTKDFNNGNLEVCIISTRAGGQGLNLYGANRVVIMDDHYNPMYEEQAIGRAYRMGQKKAVFVYHLMVGGTFEEVLHNQSVFKQQLAKRVVDKKNPARRALRGISEYLQSPILLEQQNLGKFYGNDKLVLDRILALQDKNPIIRSMDFTETFHQEEPISLTLEEKREAAQLQKDEQLRRADPVAYELQMRQRRWDQQRAIDEQISATRAQQMQPHVGPGPDPHETFLNFQNTTMHSPPPAQHTIPQRSTIDPMVGVELTTPALTQDPIPIPKSPLSLHLERAGLLPVQASNTRLQLRATESPEKHTHPSSDGHPFKKASTASPVPSSEALKVFTPFPALQNLLQREEMRMKKRETE